MKPIQPDWGRSSHAVGAVHYSTKATDLRHSMNSYEPEQSMLRHAALLIM